MRTLAFVVLVVVAATAITIPGYTPPPPHERTAEDGARDARQFGYGTLEWCTSFEGFLHSYPSSDTPYCDDDSFWCADVPSFMYENWYTGSYDGWILAPIFSIAARVCDISQLNLWEAGIDSENDGPDIYELGPNTARVQYFWSENPFQIYETTCSESYNDLLFTLTVRDEFRGSVQYVYQYAFHGFDLYTSTVTASWWLPDYTYNWLENYLEDSGVMSYLYDMQETQLSRINYLAQSDSRDLADCGLIPPPMAP